MSDEEVQVLQRQHEADPADQPTLTRLIVARRRAGLPVWRGLLQRCVFPARSFDPPPSDLTVTVALPDGESKVLARRDSEEACGPIDIPSHARWWVEGSPKTREALHGLIGGLVGQSPRGLKLDGTRGCPPDFSSLARLSSLRDLSLAGWRRRLTDRDLEPLAELNDLEELEVHHATTITAAGVEPLSKLSRLVHLGLYGLQHLDDESIERLGGLSSLSSLSLWSATNSGLTDLGLELLAEHNRCLEDVRLFGCLAVTDQGAKHLARLPHLRQVFGGLPALTATGFAALARSPHLRTLRLDGVEPDDVALAALGGGRITSLWLEGSRYTDDGLCALPPTLRELDLYRGRVGPAGWQHLGSLPLESALIHYTPGIDDAVLAQLAAGGQLKTLDLRNAELSAAGVAQALGRSPLEVLRLGACPPMEGLGTALAELDGLRKVELAAVGFRDEDLAALSDHSGLRWLEVHYANAITDEGLPHLYGLKDLETLRLRSSSVTRDGEAALRAALPTCSVFVGP